MSLPNRLLAMAMAALFLPVTSQFLHARTDDSTGVPSRIILYVGQLNSDCIADTLCGALDGFFHYRPVCIVWGRGVCHSDTSRPPVPANPAMRPVTWFRYPDWNGLSGSVSVKRYDRDTLDDLIISIWGRTSTGELPPVKRRGTVISSVVPPSPQPRDTMKIVAIMGGSGLDTVSEVGIGEIPPMQISPFGARTLRVGRELVAPKIRDLSGVPSYILPRLRTGGKGDSIPVPHPVADTEPPLTLHVYPNPAGSSASIESHTLSPGRYEVEIITNEGAIAIRRQVTVGDRGLFATIGTEQLPNGYYRVRVYSRRRLVGTYPMIVAR